MLTQTAQFCPRRNLLVAWVGVDRLLNLTLSETKQNLGCIYWYTCLVLADSQHPQMTGYPQTVRLSTYIFIYLFIKPYFKFTLFFFDKCHVIMNISFHSR